MKNLSLTLKIWLALSLVSLLLYLVVIFIMPFLVRSFFTDTLMEPRTPPKGGIKQGFPYNHIGPQGLNIREFTLLDDGTIIPLDAAHFLTEDLQQQIWQNALLQESSRQYYECKNDYELRYVIKKDTIYGRSLYQVTLLRKSEEDRFIKTFLFNTMLYAGIALVISWFASLFVARYLTRSLIKIKQHVKRIANRNWHDSIDIKQGDEIGQLADSIETMRKQLIMQDETQKLMLQNISHELKTPVMVIRSYVQAIQDGIYPKGDLEGSIKVIGEECVRLERLVKQLLYLNRIDYLEAKPTVKKNVNLKELIESIIERFKVRRPEITWEVNLKPVNVEGDAQMLQVMVENLLENHINHATRYLDISLTVDSENRKATIYFWNDGSSLEPGKIKQLFQPFQKGHKGKHGLGLTIVQRILKMHQGDINLKNERNGVSSTVTIPYLGLFES